MKKRNYKRSYVVFACLCCVAGLRAAASSKGYDVSGEVAFDGGMVCLSQKPVSEQPLSDYGAQPRGSVAVLTDVGHYQNSEDKGDVGPYVRKFIEGIFGFSASKTAKPYRISVSNRERLFGKKILSAVSTQREKLFGPSSSDRDVTIVYKEVFTGKMHQFCFSERDQMDHLLIIPTENNAVVRCRLRTCDFVYECALQGVYQDSFCASKYGVVSFVSDHMESMLQSMSESLEAVMKNSSSDCRQEAEDLWCCKNFWLKSDDQKRVWKQVDKFTDPTSEFANNSVRVTVGAVTLEGMFVQGEEFVPPDVPQSMCSVMWTDVLRGNL